MKNTQKLFEATKCDYILAGFILLFSFGSLVWVKNSSSNVGKKALIFKDGRLIREISLSREGVMNIDKMEIHIKENHIRILRSNCPQKICVHTGWITNPAQTIVCVPNKVLIEIVGVSSDDDYNAVSY